MSEDVRVRRKLFRRPLCPKCLSPLKSAGPLSGWATPAEYVCPKCGYRGYLSVEQAD
ncbi:MAG: hypothetical protein JRN39_04910 [Nitrososphaerota archaeon]|nr:hypothetical protein [Nitrososphaerota archaeon]MDG6939724.1 hypothetical protein [Nitrososphaerota archaeon]